MFELPWLATFSSVAHNDEMENIKKWNLPGRFLLAASLETLQQHSAECSVIAFDAVICI